MREYIEFHRAANENLTDSNLTISGEKYAKGFTIFGFNFSPDLSDGCGCTNYINQAQHGMIRIEIHFSFALSKNLF